MEQEKFQETVLKGVGAVTDKVDVLADEVSGMKEKDAALLKDFGQLTKDTKAAFEDLTKVKNTMNDHQATLTAMQKVQNSLALERRLAFGDPAQRIARDPEKANIVKAALAIAMRKGGKPPDHLAAYVKALYEGATPGSTMIIGDLAKDVYDVLASYGAWSTLGVRNIGRATQTMPVKTARPVALWYNTQASQIAEDATKAGTSVTMTIRSIGVLLGVANELIEDAEIDVVQDVLNDFGEACAYRLDWAALAADGTNDTTDGNYTGIFSGGTAAAAAAGNITVANLDLEDFVRCLTTVAAGVLRRSCRWWINPQVLAKICLVRDNNKRPIFQTALEAPSATIGSILGYPVVPADAAPSTDSAGNVIAAFGDPQGCVVAVRKAFDFAASEHHLFDYNEMAFRGIMRAGVIIRAATAFAKLTLAAA